ncbi:MAG TPA: class I tRNA ligase family protein, partial [Microbacterium sp.]|nr:class I tRNA ligase family protein [Microbacterium sp.]
HPLAQKDKGSGIAMICTFGDVTDIIWWRALDLPNRTILGQDGRILPDAPEALETDAACAAYAEIAGMTVFSAKKRMVELLGESGELLEVSKPFSHPVKFYEKGDRALEIVSTRQWYLRNGARDAEFREKLIALGAGMDWHPDFMRVRYENWTNGLTGDWLISRQRFFGVPIPVWYPLDENGERVDGGVITPDLEALPVDPTTDAPAGYAEDQRGVPGGFEGEKDIFDTWATSSLTPQLAGGWQRDDELWNLVAPFDLRPQGQDIIRTWLFSTMVRSALEDGRAPWTDAAISGFIVDPDRKKMSKSKGNVVTPADILEAHGTDAVRYWSASSRLGADAAFDPQNPTQVKIGRRLAIKVLNAAKFVLSFPVPEGADVTHALDAAMLATLDQVVRDATKAFEAYDHARALEVTEAFFWTFCDDYLELVKERAYNQTDVGQASAALALRLALSTLLRLLAPVLAFATEEAWSWFEEGSIHTASWPEPLGSLSSSKDAGDPRVLSAASAALIGIRRAKTEAKASQKTPVTRLVLRADDATVGALQLAEGDLKAVGRIETLELIGGGDALTVEAVELAPVESAGA